MSGLHPVPSALRNKSARCLQSPLQSHHHPVRLERTLELKGIENDVPFGYRTQQPNLLGEYLQQGVESFWLNAQTAMPPVHISAIGPNVVPHDDRFGGANLFPPHFPYNEEAGGGVLGSAFDPHHPMLSSGVTVPGWNAHALERLDRNTQMDLQRENTLNDTSLGRAKKRKRIASVYDILVHLHI